MGERCSFCGADAAAVGCLIAGPSEVFICPDCVIRCCELYHRRQPEVVERLLDRLLALLEADAAKERRREF